MKKIELLSPVANMEMCRAAVHNGADAVYVGVPNFNARRRDSDLSLSELKDIVYYCRLYDVKVYFACNILIFENEILNFGDSAREWLEFAPDAVIVQDVGLVRWLKNAVPNLPIHASTQMTIASSDGVKFAEELGITRCVLARELSMKQIAEIHKECPKMELEVFIHGALCVSYSGQCSASLNFGGRSSNRGECAQCCRLPYKLFADGKPLKTVGDYIFSTSDLCALPILNELLECGISSLKIEGRLKSAEFVASVTAAYRNALDTRQYQHKRNSADTATRNLKTIFSRDFSTGWLEGGENQSVVSGTTTGHKGFFIGKVKKNFGNKVWVESSEECSAGDGILIKNGDKEFGGKVYSVKNEGKFLLLEFAKDKNLDGINDNFKVYVNQSDKVVKEVMNFSEKKIPVSVELSGNVGKHLVLKMNDITVQSEFVLESRKSAQTFNTSFLTLNFPPYFCENPIINISPAVFVNEKMIRNIRQRAVELLNEKRTARKIIYNQQPDSLLIPHSKLLTYKLKNNSDADIILNFSTDLQIELEKARKLNLRVGIATPHIHQNADVALLEKIIALKPDFILVRSFGALHFLKNCGIELQGNYSLNVSNSLSAEYLLQNGLTSVRPALDLCENKKSPVFYTKHCLFSYAFSQNKIFPKCGMPCKSHSLEIEDRKGKRYSVFTEGEYGHSLGNCRNAVYQCHSPA